MLNRTKSIEVTAVVTQCSEQKLILIDSSPYKPYVKTKITVYPNLVTLEPDPEAERIRKLRKMTLAQLVVLEQKRKEGTLTKEEKELVISRRNTAESSAEDSMEKSQEDSQAESMPTREELDQLLHQQEIIPLKVLERLAICQALVSCNGNKAQSAKKLGISEKTIYNKIKEYKIRFPFVEIQVHRQDDNNVDL